MIYSNYHIQEPKSVTAEDCPTLFFDSYDIPGVYEDCPQFFEAICFPCPPLLSDSPCQEDSFQDFVSSAYSGEEAYYANNPYEDEQLPCSNWRNFGSKYESCFTFGDCWDDDLSSYGNSTDTNGNGIGLRGREECFLGEEQRDIYSGIYENKENDFSYYDDNPWSGYESWFDERKGDTFLNYGGNEHRYACSYSLDEIGICEGLFGYWPCLTR
ncbi:hypothetical protein OIU79_011765 [Salix purpurea]|uniref:Uncharacterized protein n=1 Tax=Salix purpurea TaxID=77065 RepID=A0A9Q0Q234_SALPP|nr:hypothetical protein OIU79_011765 [Salix purpurea]